MYASIIIINVMQNFDEKSVCFGWHMAFFKGGPEARAIRVNIHWIKGSKLERKADKLREVVAMFGWLTPLYLVVFYVSLPIEIKLLLFNIFFFGFNPFYFCFV